MPEQPPRRDSIPTEIAKIAFPILLAAGISYWTAQSAAQARIDTEIAVIKEREGLHFQEIQRRLEDLNTAVAQAQAQRRGK